MAPFRDIVGLDAAAVFGNHPAFGHNLDLPDSDQG